MGESCIITANSIKLRKVEQGEFRGSEREEAREQSYKQRPWRTVREQAPFRGSLLGWLTFIITFRAFNWFCALFEISPSI